MGLCELMCVKCGVNCNNYEEVNPKEAEKKLRTKDPKVLPEDEHVKKAYKLRQSKIYFTPKRIVYKTAWATSKAKRYYSTIPYSAIGGYDFTTAGKVDADCKLTLYLKNDHDHTLEFDLLKDKVQMGDILGILNEMCLPSVDLFADGFGDKMNRDKTLGDDIPPACTVPDSQGFGDWLGGNAAQLAPKDVEAKMNDFLVKGEKVKLAFKSGRDMFIFTTRRFMFVDTKGFTGTSIGYQSILYDCICMYSLETASDSMFDQDAELMMGTILRGCPYIKSDLKKNVDIPTITRFLTDMIIGPDVDGPTSAEAANVDRGGGDRESSWKPKWMGGEGNAGQVDAGEADKMFHTGASNVLQKHEKVEMAFKGKKDYTLFTTKRLLIVDNKSVGMIYVTQG